MSNTDITLRIIGGNWRSRKVSFPDRPGLRPTPDRVRETLFNWLQFDVAGSHCLELYAGSGVLSMEALSRGADHACLVEKDREAFAALEKNLSTLCPDSNRYTCIHGSAAEFPGTWTGSAFDLVFLDPPFATESFMADLTALLERNLIHRDTQCYLESGHALDPASIPKGFSLKRQKSAGQVHYCLLEVGSKILR